MSYNNYNDYGGNYGRSNYGGGYSRGNYGGGYNRSYGRRNDGYQRQTKKHSGAKYHASTKNGNPCISAWNYSKKMGMLSILIAPYKGSKVVESQTGRRYGVWMASITGKGVRQNFPVLVDLASHRVVIREGYGWVINPSAPNGGYCGTFTRNNNRR